MDSHTVALRKFSEWKERKTVLKLTKEEPDGKESLKARGRIGFVDDIDLVVSFESERPTRSFIPLPDLHIAEFAVADEIVEVRFPNGTRFVLEKDP